MVARVNTVAFAGIEVLDVDVQVQTSSGLPSFSVVGLPDKAVAESRERVRSALHAMGLALPNQRITVNLSPADLTKEGSHFDLPIAIGLLAAMGVLPLEELDAYTALGELALDGALKPVSGVLPAAVHANATGRGLICPAEQGPEAAWAGDMEIIAPAGLLALVNHLKGAQIIARPEVRPAAPGAMPGNASPPPDMADIKGQESAKRALEIAAAGGHHVLLSSPPGAGKSMLAARLAGLLPSLTSPEILEVSMIQSLAGELSAGELTQRRPYRDPHHSASVAAIIGGGHRVRPGEVSLAHHGVLFLDELPEFQRPALESLRQPLESGRAVIARANSHVSFPARFQLVAAMNPCRCGYLSDPAQACSRAPNCAETYQNRISGFLMDRFDLHVDVPAVSPADLSLPPAAEGTAAMAARVAETRARQTARFQSADAGEALRCNADAGGGVLEDIAHARPDATALLVEAAERFRLSARGYHRVLRVARTIADMEGAGAIARAHMAEALGYRRLRPGRRAA